MTGATLTAGAGETSDRLKGDVDFEKGTRRLSYVIEGAKSGYPGHLTRCGLPFRRGRPDAGAI